MRAEESIGLWRTAEGSVFFRDSYFALDHRHGRLRLDAALDDGMTPTATGFSLTAKDMKQAAFVDIESGPQSELSDSFALVVGIGRFEPFYFHLRQLFHREDTSLECLLLTLNDLLANAQFVVTFNGTAFDLPHLAARFEVAGIASPFDKLQHLDLLHVARSTYGLGLKSRRLREIEQTTLGFERLRRPYGGTNVTHPIFQHNAFDVLSMVVLLAYLSREAGHRSKSDPRYLVSLRRMALRRGDLESALTSFRAAWTLDPHGLSGADAVMRLAALLGRLGRRDECLAVWNDELQLSQRLERQIRARVELAKLHERHLKDSQGALLIAEQALRLINESASERLYEKSLADLGSRVLRLRTRLGADRRA